MGERRTAVYIIERPCKCTVDLLFSVADVDPSCESVYLCGNSLGLQPKLARTKVLEAMDSWAARLILFVHLVTCLLYINYVIRGVRGHFLGSNPWMPIEDSVIEGSAKLVGAKNIEVAMMNSLTVNLHLGLVSLNIC